ncbi:hypothetical protein ABLU29_07580 [Lactococcus lactis]|uniref:hypothetical protein n=1 Tax=Lactococcus lactis TaxID=1358 RepID=UPI003877AB3E
MYYKKELKAALKELKKKNDFTYQAGVNDTLDLLDEMADYIIFDKKDEKIQSLEASQGLHSANLKKIGESKLPNNLESPQLDFSVFERMTSELSNSPVPKPVSLEVPKFSAHISEEDLVDNSEIVEKAGTITEHPAFQGWAENEKLENNEPSTDRTNEAVQEVAQKDEQLLAQVPLNEEEPSENETNGILSQKEEPSTLNSSPEEQRKLEEASLLAEAKAQAIRDAEENDDEDYDD